MATLLYLLAGLAAGILGGMGMGGGTILIPVLTIFFGVNQRIAQSTNLIAFLPMAAIALPTHKKNGLIQTKNAGYIIIPALISTVLGGLVMAVLPVEFLKKLFGFFLIAIAIKECVTLTKTLKLKPS